MRASVRFPAIVCTGVAVVLLSACATRYPEANSQSYPSYSTYPTYPANAPPPGNYQTTGVEFGRITGIEYVPPGTSGGNNSGVVGAIVGGLAGAALGNQIGSGSGRAAATVLGGAAGAVVGSQIQRNSQGTTTSPGYRVTVQTEQGAWRTYELSATGDLRVGDRVRVENGVIYRY